MTGIELWRLESTGELCETGVFWMRRALTRSEWVSYQYESTQDTFIARKHRDIV